MRGKDGNTVNGFAWWWVVMFQLRIPVGWSTTDLSAGVTIGTVPLREFDHLSNIGPPQRMSMIDRECSCFTFFFLFFFKVLHVKGTGLRKRCFVQQTQEISMNT